MSQALRFFLFSTICMQGLKVSCSTHCNTETLVTLETHCTNCRNNLNVKCPTGYQKVTKGRGKSGCRYRIGSLFGRRGHLVRGCSHTCIRTETEAQCCSNFWGSDCQECPRGRLRSDICSGYGECYDGISGNGTCKCRGNIAGSACEICAQPNQYGPNCEQTCTCVHGRCDSGVGQSGQCECDSGFGGSNCNISLLGCLSFNCSLHSKCLNESGTLHCQCNIGYEGNGTFCTEINPCLNNGSNLCHTFANCLHTGPATYSCKCKVGYTGDGFYCSPVDPCQYNNGGCSINSTTCLYIAPGQSTCKCKPGYKNVTDSACDLIDICGSFPNTTCDSIANCTTVNENEIVRVKCYCPVNTVTVGLRCVTDVLSELILANSSGPFHNMLNKAIHMFNLHYYDYLTFSTPFTLLVPKDDAFGSELGEPNESFLWKTRTRNHMVATRVEIDFIVQTAYSMYSLLGSNNSITAVPPQQDSNEDDDDAGTFAQLTYNGWIINMLDSAQLAANGVFYIVDQFVNLPDFALNYDSSNTSFAKILENLPSVSRFKNLWKKSYVMRGWIQRSRFTAFLPSNDAFSSLDNDDLKFLSSPAGIFKLNNVLLHHLLPTPVTMLELTGLSKLNTAFEELSLTVSDSGAILLGDQQSKILLSEIIISGGSYIYVIDKVLLPSSIIPLVKSSCKNVEEQNILGDCGDCFNYICPNGAVLASNESHQCLYEAIIRGETVGRRLGCKYFCKKNVTTDVCCSGFFGRNCMSCPGPTHLPCNNHGICMDGKQGSGVCNCFEGFAGEDCSLCNSTSKYGPKCLENCTCQRGKCDTTISSRGICVPGSCLEGWSGENCELRSHPCGTPSLVCHQHGHCAIINGTERCVCLPGYTGNGLDCIIFNPCLDSLNFGGCHEKAICLHLGQGNYTCQCIELYTGNGFQCSPINPCNAPDNGCNSNADCLYTGPGEMQCQCRNGFRGNGVVCVGINSCLENNGGCSSRANCTSTGPGTSKCECLDGYQGDGFQCVGSLTVEITEHPQLFVIKHWMESVSAVGQLLTSVQSTKLTAFFPNNEAFRAMSADDFRFWSTNEHLPFLLRHHMVDKVITSQMLGQYKEIQTILPSSSIVVTNVTDGIIITNSANNRSSTHLIPTLGPEHAKIIVPDLGTSTGLVHIIDQVLLPPRDVVDDHPRLSDLIENSTATRFSDYSLFLSYLNQSGVASRIEVSHEPYTVFLLSNRRFNPDSVAKPIERVFSYHVILGKLIRLQSINSGQHETTMAGTGYQVTLTRNHERFLVNGQEIVGGDMRTEHGVMHGLESRLLQPIKQYCEKLTKRWKLTPCGPCLPSLSTCPDGSAPMFRVFRAKCAPKDGFTSFVHGHHTILCRLFCTELSIVPECCKGFFGTDCEPCPGSINHVCFGRGVCHDGMRGRGTCHCNANYSGPACDECAPNLYGEDCDNKCTCVNGTCVAGKTGSGMCICHEGYTGRNCDMMKNPNDTCSGACSSSAHCVSTLPGIGMCVCDEGFTGTGNSCIPINPCSNPQSIRCHPFASCKYRSAGLYQCLCKDGYTGDGTYCSEINPCLTANFSECDVNADCHHVGPAQHHCICKLGYTGDGKSCQPLDPCRPGNTNCHMFARCIRTGPISHRCQCLDDYMGNGVTNCTGTIYIELSGDPQFSWFSNGGSLFQATLSSSGPITAFLPGSPQLVTSSGYQTMYQFILDHVVGCERLEIEDFIGLTEVTALSGRRITVISNQTNVVMDGNISISNGRNYANGIVYVINGTFSHPPANSMNTIIRNGSDLEKNQDMFRSLATNRFLRLLKYTDSLLMLSNSIHESWTLFVPSDSAFNQLSTYKQRQLNTNFATAREYARFHMVRRSLLQPSDAIGLRELVTMQGSMVDIKCSSQNVGQLVVSNGFASVLKFSTETLYSGTGPQRSAVYIIDRVLEPPSVGGRCDIITNHTIQGTCTFCVESSMSCPTGMTKVGEIPATCLSTVLNFHNSLRPHQTLSGCMPLCSFYNVSRQCCSGYYGDSCLPCPGSPVSVCSGNGQCDDGINGTGVCRCRNGFRGFACELCDIGRFGPNCSLCNCSIHGSCAEGILGDGQCNCDEGWTGRTCDQKTAPSSVCNSSCVDHADCLEGGTCQCRHGYAGLGNISCFLINFCALNPCSIHATCSMTAFNGSCTCNHPYIGDGFVCENVDPCSADGNSGRCHAMARCRMDLTPPRCQCLPGYHGDGRSWCMLDTDLNSPKYCDANHGGCSPNAACVDIPQTSHFTVPSVNCTCMSGYIGNGLVCNGNLYQVITSGTYDTGRFFRKVIRKNVLSVVRLRQFSNMTLFIPSDDILMGRRVNRRILSRHMTSGGVYTMEDLRSMSFLMMNSGRALSLRSENGSVFIGGVKIRVGDILATNGIIHIIDGVIPFRRPAVASSTTLGVISTQHLDAKGTNPFSFLPTSPSTSFPLPSTGFTFRSTQFLSSVTIIKRPSTTQLTSSSSTKVGIALGIIGVIMIIIGAGYCWKRRRNVFLFRPLLEPSMVTQGDETFGIGSSIDNPTYDSTTFAEDADDSLIVS